MRLNYAALRCVCSLILAVASFSTALGQMGSPHKPDPNFKTEVSRPAFIAKHPKLLFDEAHSNEGLSAKYAALLAMLKNDGFTVTTGSQKLSPEGLAPYDVLVIVNAASGKKSERFSTPAFAEAECIAVREWVGNGGALLLIAGSAPYGLASGGLARNFGVEMSNGRVTDKENREPDTPLFNIRFTAEKGVLSDHAITRGRDETERIGKVVTFGGQSLSVPAGAAALLRLSPTAMETPGITAAEVKEALAKAEPGSTMVVGPARKAPVPAAGRAQAVALSIGKGRVVVLADDKVFLAELIGGQIARIEGKEFAVGMSLPGVDNRQLALNIMRWLGGPFDSPTRESSAARPTAQKDPRDASAAALGKKRWEAPTFDFVSLDGKRFDLTSLRGRIVVLNFWFLECGPCIAEMPDLNKLVADYRSRDVVFLSFALDAEKPLREFLKSHEFLYELAPNASNVIMGKYQASIFPTHIIIDRRGNVAVELVGKNHFNELRASLDQITQEPSE